MSYTGKILPSSFLNSGECLGSIKWQSSWATTCRMKSGSWVASSQWNRKLPDEVQLPQRFPNSRTWKVGTPIIKIAAYWVSHCGK